ncbi:MAG: ribonuclease III [Candidatus Eremiobacteraeota bacterium]|nr:ribonuclease III [Candidatus Eremiobacteraeota bacterium]MBV8366793.1 ribonuclease III [Candidatus Eremiobacteraeota bacterium]
MSEGLARRKALRELGRRLGIRATASGDCALLDRALTHGSFVFEQRAKGHQLSNERLEFLGDSVIGLAAAAWLHDRYPDEPEGRLSRRRQQLVSGAALARSAAQLGLSAALRLGKGETRGAGAHRPSILADAFEAVVGAVFVCEGYNAAARFVQRVHLSQTESVARADARTALQELSQARFKAAPRYEFAGETGPPHARVFVARVSAGSVVGTGRGPTKKTAQAEAAADALRKLG